MGSRLPDGVQQRVLAGLGLTTLVIGVESALDYEPNSFLIVLGAVLVGGVAGELMGIEAGLQRLGDRLQGAREGTVSEAFFTASLLFCAGPLTVLGSIQDGLGNGIDLLATKSLLDGFAALAISSALGYGVAFSAGTILVVQGGLTLAAGLFEDALADGSAELAALTSAGGILIIAIALKLLEIRDLKVGNLLPALLAAPLLAALVEAL